MLERQFTHQMLKPADLAPLRAQTRVVGTFNPGAAAFEGGIVLLVRVVEEITETREGHVASPRINENRELVTDWIKADECDLSDPRVYELKKDGRLRLRFISHIKVVFSSDGKIADNLDGRVITPKGEYEEYGIEDPRITQLGGTYYITYVGVSRHGVCTCLMSTTDFHTFQRHGIILAPDNKDVVLFPEKIMGSYIAMHRPMPSMKFSPPAIWLARSNDLTHWGKHEQLHGGDTDVERVGGGTAPLRTERGWLTIYHGNEKTPPDESGNVRVCYTGGAMLMDIQNPAIILGRSAAPIMVPTESFETSGFVDNVVFPTAAIDRGDAIWVYYGAADESVGVTAFDKNALLATVAG